MGVGRSLVAVLATALALVAGGCGGDSGGSGGSVELNFWAYDDDTLRAAAANCTKQNSDRYRIKFQALGRDANTQRTQLVRRLAAEDSSIDLMSMDVIWTAEFAEAEWIKPYPPAVAARIRKGTLPGPLATATYNGRLYGAPGNSNTQLLWYRKDLVEKPATTWDGLIDQAEKLPEAGRIQVQAANYEGYMVWFNALVQSAGGEIVNKQGESELGPPAVEAARIISKLANSKAADPSITTQKEDQNRLAFEEGTSAFEINYPFIYPSAKENAPDIFKNLGWTFYPAVREGERVRPPIGGFNWGVGSYTKYPEQAFAAAECLRSEENQRQFALVGGLPPTLSSLYDDPEFKKAYPFGDLIRKSLAQAGVRPVTPAYADISLAVTNALSPPASVDPKSIVDKLNQAIEDAADSKALL